MIRRRAAFATTALALATAAVAQEAEPPAAGASAEPPAAANPLEVRIDGTWVMPPEVYRAVLDLPPDATATPETADRVRESLTGFLHRAGYELARVSAIAEDGAIDVRINEGRLEKVVFRGRLTLKTVQFKLALAIPHEVFNRPQLDREIRELCARLGIDAVRYELVPTGKVNHLGPQLDDIGTLKGHALIKPREPYELHLFFTENPWDTGLGVDLRVGSPDGAEIGLNYQGHGLLFQGDRWRVAGSGGAGLRRVVQADGAASGDIYGSFSRAFGEFRWYTPPVLGVTRPYVWAWVDVTSRQRGDVNLENYFGALGGASLNLELEVLTGLRLSLGGGAEQRFLFGFQRVDTQKPFPENWDAQRSKILDLNRSRFFYRAAADLVFDVEAERWDRRHGLWGEVRHYLGVHDPSFGVATAAYQKVFALGWHDLWLRARGHLSWGEVQFNDEVPVGGLYLRGVYGDEFVRKAAALSAEFRFSVTRDLYKLSVFHDLAVFESVHRYPPPGRVLVGNSFGPGFHALVEDMIQIDIYVAFGFVSDGRFDVKAAALLQKVY